MTTQWIIWTLLPDPGAPTTGDGTVQLSLVVSPRLTVDARDPDELRAGDGDREAPKLTLSDFPDVAAWPEVDLGLSVELTTTSGGTILPAVLLEDPPDASLWRAIFPLDMPVEPFDFADKVPDVPIVGFPAEPLRAALATQYSEMLEPEPAPDRIAADRAARRPDAWERVDRLIRAVRGDAPRPTGSGAGRRALREETEPDLVDDDPAGWARVVDFHRPEPDRTLEDDVAARRREPGRGAEREFHRVVAALADHPKMLARLGLVRRARITLPPALAQGVREPFSVRARPSHGRTVADYRPRTKCVVREGAPELFDGAGSALYLPLHEPRFTVMDLDVDAAALAFESFVTTLERAPRTAPPPELRPPVLRSAGLAVVEAERQASFKEALRRAARDIEGDLADGGDGNAITLDARDVLQGYRVDVLDEASRRWYPLCCRDVTYGLKAVPPFTIRDEGTVSEVLVWSEREGKPVGKLHQALFRWNGWSLIAPPPGKMLDRSGEIADPVPTADPSLPFQATAKPPAGSLPSLRYGRAYRFRARLVDIAGQSIPFTAEPDPAVPATGAFRYSRYEPVPSPVLVARRPVSEGESATTLVVRTDNSDPALPMPGPTCERHLLAPKASVLMLEHHGVLDAPAENRPDPAVFALLAARDAGVVKGTPDPGSSDAQFVDADTMELPWLPDPLARGVSMQGLPGSADVRIAWPQGNAWHERLPLRLVVEPGSAPGAPTVRVDPERRTLAVTAEPGADLAVMLSTHLNPGDEDVLGTWRFLTDRTPETAPARREHAAAGRLGQLTPSQPLRIVHAVRCPLEPPVFVQPSVSRERASTSFVLADAAMTTDRATTLSVHVQAAWTDLVDDPEDDDGPKSVTGSAVLEQGGDGDPATAVPDGFITRRDLGDTRHRLMECTPVAVSRFAAFFTESRIVQLSGIDAVPIAQAFIPGTVVVREAPSPPPTGDGRRSELPKTFGANDVDVNATDGTVARRPDGAIAAGQEVEVRFVTPPITRAGAPVRISVPSSARPAPPTVRAVVPAYAWERRREGGTITSVRHGGILRVFLERPWYSSGRGELLAVLIGDEELAENHPAIFDRTRPFVSFPLDDPTALGGPGETLTRSSFPRAVADRIVRIPGLRDTDPDLAEESSCRIRALGHGVEFDTDRRVWFSDVQILHGTHEPFVHLRLARLQPSAVGATPGAPLEDLHLSGIVDAGFHRLVSERQATVVLDPGQARVTVSGGVATQLPTTPQLTVALEVGPPPSGDPLVWEAVDELDEVALAASGVSGNHYLRVWSGSVALPQAPGTTPMRLVIREYETLPGDPLSDEPVRRVSYLDVLEL